MALLVRDTSFYKNLVRLAIPIALQSFITFAIGFAANLMVGTLGENAIAGVYMGNQIQTFLQFYVTGIDAALVILAAQYWGVGNTDSIKKLVSIAISMSVLGGIAVTVVSLIIPEQLLRLFTPDENVIAEGVSYVRIVAVSYTLFSISQILIATMRSVENVKIGLGISVMALATSVVLNYVFIFGKLGMPQMGVAGAALATLVSRVLELSAIVIYVLCIDKKLHMRLKEFLSWDNTLFRDFVRYGLPVLGGNVVWAVNNLAQSAIIGRMGAEAVASVSVTGMLSNLLFVGVFGLSAGLGIITGKTVGAGQFDLMKQYSKTAQIIFTVIGFVVGAAIFIVKDYFLMLYNLSDTTMVVARQFMTVLAIAAVGRSYQATCLAGLVKAGGDTGFVFKNDTIFVFLVVLPSALIAMYVFDAPPWVVYACLQSDQVLKCAVAVVKINRYKWMKKLTRAEPAAIEAKAVE